MQPVIMDLSSFDTPTVLTPGCFGDWLAVSDQPMWPLSGPLLPQGIETVRRDNCGLVRQVVATCLDKILIDRWGGGRVDTGRRKSVRCALGWAAVGGDWGQGPGVHRQGCKSPDGLNASTPDGCCHRHFVGSPTPHHHLQDKPAQAPQRPVFCLARPP